MTIVPRTMSIICDTNTKAVHYRFQLRLGRNCFSSGSCLFHFNATFKRRSFHAGTTTGHADFHIAIATGRRADLSRISSGTQRDCATQSPNKMGLRQSSRWVLDRRRTSHLLFGRSSFLSFVRLTNQHPSCTNGRYFRRPFFVSHQH